MAIFIGKIGEGMGRYWPPTNSFLVGENRQRNATVRVATHGQTQTHRRTKANRFYYLSQAICCGTDNDSDYEHVTQTDNSDIIAL